MEPKRPLPVTFVTGFLGSGKTSLLNRLLGESAFSDSAVIVNEFGAIGLDHQLIATAKDSIFLLEAGCLCCVMVDSLRETLADLYARRANGQVPRFSRLLIETSGLADPTPSLQTIMMDGVVAPLFTVAGVLCLIDALHGVPTLDEHREAREQAAIADRLVVTKGAPSAELRDRLIQLNPTADVVLCPPAGQSVAALFTLDRLGSIGGRAHAHDHDRHDSEIGSESFRIASPVSWAGVSAWTSHLRERFGDDLLRCKALLQLTGGGQVLIQGVRRLFEIRRADDIAWPAAGGAIVCIGRGLDREQLRRGLAWLEAAEGTTMPPTPGFAPWASTMETL